MPGSAAEPWGGGQGEGGQQADAVLDGGQLLDDRGVGQLAGLARLPASSLQAYTGSLLLSGLTVWWWLL